MINMLSKNEPLSPVVENIKNIISLIATCIGLVVIIIGLKYAMDIIQIIFTILQSPTYLTDPIRQMADVVGGNVFDQRYEDRSAFITNMLALIIYCCGILVCAWLTLALMQTGAKIVSLSVGDRSAVKKLLQSAFGKSPYPKSTGEDDDIKVRSGSRTQS